MRAGKSDPYFKISRQTGATWALVHTSEVRPLQPKLYGGGSSVLCH